MRRHQRTRRPEKKLRRAQKPRTAPYDLRPLSHHESKIARRKDRLIRH